MLIIRKMSVLPNLIYRLNIIASDHPIGDIFWNLRNNFQMYLENDKAKNSPGTSKEDDQAGELAYPM